ncbi:MAG: response regulator transcription factor [Bacteroidetes bacterium]|nr:response regulator transcription factor [Bacteroidota bacterium]
MLHAVIIDDEMNGLVSLELMIKKYTPEIKIVAKCDDAFEGVEAIDNYRPDIVFLDINMPKLNGFEVLEKVDFKKFQIIFTTAHEEYALKAIKKNALDYLLKPISADDLVNAFKRANKNLGKENSMQNALQFLTNFKESDEFKVGVPGKNGIDLVPASDIMYIEAKSNQAVVVLKNKSKIEVSRSLKDYEKQLCYKTSKFIRLHNSFIVNVNYVSRYLPEDGGYAMIQSEKSVPISKNKKEEFLSKINFNLR